MSVNCTCLPKPRPLKCQFPPCPCKVCKEQRLTGGSSRNPCGRRDAENNAEATANFFTYAMETISIIAFLIVTTTIFWLNVCYYLYQLGIKVYKAERNAQIAILICVTLIMLSVTCRYIAKSIRSRCKKVKPPAEPHYIDRKAGDKIELALKNIRDLTKCCNPTNSTAIVMKNITITITDSEAREIFKKSKLFAIPTEMKQPPALLVYLRDVILRNY